MKGLSPVVSLAPTALLSERPKDGHSRRNRRAAVSGIPVLPDSALEGALPALLRHPGLGNLDLSAEATSAASAAGNSVA
jgi:hypothetical protein